MVRDIILILMIFLCPLGLTGQVPFSFFHLEAKEAFSGQPAHHISQDDRGDIWIATGSGVMRMNGAHTKRYSVPDDLAINDVRVLLHNQDGSAWIATAGSLVKLTADGTFIPHGLPYIRENRIFDMIRDELGSVWFLGGEQVFCLDSLNHVQAWTKGETGLSGAWKIDHGYHHQGIRILSSSGKVEMTADGPSPVQNSTMFSGQEIQPYPQENVYGQRRYIEFKDKLVLSLLAEEDSISHEMTVLASDLRDVFIDREGNIWVGTQTEGLYMISRFQVAMFYSQLEKRSKEHEHASHPESGIKTLANGGVYLTQDNRVLQSGSQLSGWQLPKDEEILYLVTVGKGWMAASSASVFHHDGSEGSYKSIRLPQITHLGTAADHQILLSLENRFHYQFSPDRLPELFDASSPASWLSTTTAWAQEGFSYKGIRSKDGTWITLVNGGIIIKTAEEAREEVGTISITGDYLDIISWDSATVLAYTKQGDFLFVRDGEADLSAENVYSWPYGPVSGAVFDRKTEQLHVFSRQGVVRFGGLNSLFESRQGYLVPGTSPLVEEIRSAASSDEGLRILVNEEIWTLPVPSLPVVPEIDLRVDCVYISGSACTSPWQGIRKFPLDSAGITIEFSIGSYAFLSSQVFEYQIDGENWVPVQDGTISFSNLSIGEYHLFLRLRSGNSLLAKSTEVLAFVITPPFYQSWWFVFIAAMLLVGLIWAGMNLYYGENERKKLEVLVEQRTRDLDHSIVELQQKNQDLEQFAYITSHDLKSPLRGMIGHLQLLERKYADALGEKGRKSMGHAVGEAKRMYEMVNDLLDFASVGSEKLNKRKVTLDHLLQNLIQGMSRYLKEIDGHVEVGPMPVVDVVPGQWETLFRNLIENGLKFNDSVTPTISISYEKKDQTYHFVVSDNGIGMDEKYQEKAFELYGRLNPEYPGTGIGLAICKKVVERHGGEIWIASQPGEGTTFHFTVPITVANVSGRGK